MKAFMPKGSRFPVVTADNRYLKPWRQDVAIAALQARNQAGIHDVSEEAVEVSVRFYFAKPKSTSKRVVHKITKPDSDKCLRAILDAMTGVLYRDDAQVIDQHTQKRFGLPERAEVSVSFIPASLPVTPREPRLRA